ncbi:hypothetical protein H6F90_25400 [Trichocoleus sp. FACHB-591]|uniref:hypothetical protein n=1 Tax=Trichocoleus sp. FACHB-591 TaxID=2692872 RepID=UPI0016832CD7|nr:hypothetical protein [Trichocoleus sp. FACHB-591]MBD2098412.1 hypothetical protein [Trichocoleus sp. FACHB-591]
MKFFRLALLALALLVSLAIAPPAWADPNFTKGSDYAEVTQALDELLQAKNSPNQAGYRGEEVQQKLADLQFQKYVLETAKEQAQCRNETGRTIAVYASKPKKSPTPQLYFLGNGKVTDDDWKCSGVYLPSGAQVALTPNAQAEELAEPIAFKIVDGTQLIAKSNPNSGVLEFNVSPAKVFTASEPGWSIPNLSLADIEATAPNAPIED